MKPISENGDKCKSILFHLEAGKRLFWCSCGKSGKLPHCDGSHKGSGLKPKRFMYSEDMEIMVCMCQRTKEPPYCTGESKENQ